VIGKYFIAIVCRAQTLDRFPFAIVDFLLKIILFIVPLLAIFFQNDFNDDSVTEILPYFTHFSCRKVLKPQHPYK